jgi:lysozyme family protein
MDLKTILDDALRREGWPKITDYPWDDGKLTKGGVTFRSFNAWRQQRGLPAFTVEEFHNLTEADARLFLTDSIIGPIQLVSAINLRLFVVMADWAMTSGPDDPTLALQQQLNQRLRLQPPLKEDGAFGPKTEAALQAANALDQLAITNGVAKQRVRVYVRQTTHDRDVLAFRATTNTTNLENLEGWVNRALDFL